jgi:hypothetical protein
VLIGLANFESQVFSISSGKGLNSKTGLLRSNSLIPVFRLLRCRLARKLEMRNDGPQWIPYDFDSHDGLVADRKKPSRDVNGFPTRELTASLVDSVSLWRSRRVRPTQ